MSDTIVTFTLEQLEKHNKEFMDKARKDERERIIKELERLKDIAWQDTDSELRIVKANAWDKVDLLNKAIEIVRGGEDE